MCNARDYYTDYYSDYYSAVREAFTAVCNLCGQRGAAYLLPRLEHLRRSLLSREEGPPAGVLDPQVPNHKSVR